MDGKLPGLLAWVLTLLGLICLSACNGIRPAVQGEKLRVLATTTIVGDILGQVGGERIELNILLPVGADPHTFNPSPQDVAEISNADLVFANGVGLEVFLTSLIESAGKEARVIYVSDGVQLMRLGHQETDQEENDAHSREEWDPHTWTDPNNVKIWVENIEAALSEVDPAGSSIYHENAQVYQNELAEIDAWIRSQVDRVAQGNRVLISDHLAWGYFAERYGFKMAGAIISSFSTLAEPSAQELVELEGMIQTLGVNAIFVDKSVNPTLAERIAQDVGAQIIFLYSGSLTEVGGEAGTYLDFMHYNVNAIVSALK